jgi:hypothetical protein
LEAKGRDIQELQVLLQHGQGRPEGVELFLFNRLPQLARKSTPLDNDREHYFHLRKVFGLTLEFRSKLISKTLVFEISLLPLPANNIPN